MTNFDKEMQDALRADAEKLRATGVDVADPVFMDDGMPEPSYPEPTWADLMAMRSVVSFERLQRQREMEAVRQEVGALKAERDALREVVVTMLGAIDKGAVDSEEIVPVPGDGPPYRFHEEWAHHARKLLEPTTPNTEDE